MGRSSALDQKIPKVKVIPLIRFSAMAESQFGLVSYCLPNLSGWDRRGQINCCLYYFGGNKQKPSFLELKGGLGLFGDLAY